MWKIILGNSSPNPSNADIVSPILTPVYIIGLGTYNEFKSIRDNVVKKVEKIILQIMLK